jgi:hypothetical protein
MIGAELLNYARRMLADWRGGPPSVAAALDELAARAKGINVYDSAGGQSFGVAALLTFNQVRYNTQPAIFALSAGQVTISRLGFYLVQFYCGASSQAAKRNPTAELYMDAGTAIAGAVWQATTSGVAGELVHGGATAIIEVTAAGQTVWVQISAAGGTQRPATVANRSGMIIVGPLA